MIVEDGSGVADANSYVSVEEADRYFGERLLDVWTGETDKKEGALISATEFIDLKFARRFIGERVITNQALEWPRKLIDTIPETVIPTALKRATMEYAYRAITGRLYKDPSETGSLRRELKRVGPLVKETEYFDKTGHQYVGYPYADLMLRELLNPLTGFGRVIRS